MQFTSLYAYLNSSVGEKKCSLGAERDLPSVSSDQQEKISSQWKSVRVLGPDLQMFPHCKELFAVLYEILQDVFVNKFRMCFVQQTHLPELTDSMGMF